MRFSESVQDEEFLAAAQRAAIDIVFAVVDDVIKLKDADGVAKLEALIQTRKQTLEKIAPPKRITAEHEQRVLGKHRDVVAAKLSEFLELPDGLRTALADLAINEVFKRPAELFSTAGLVFAGFGDYDIFPKMVEYQSAGMLDGIQVIDEQQRETVDHGSPATLNAFAQTSMSDTFSIGFSQDVYTALMDGF